MENENIMESKIMTGETCLEKTFSETLWAMGVNGPNTVRGVQIDPSGWRIAHLNIDEFRSMTESEKVDMMSVRICGKVYGCLYIRDGSAKGLPLSTLGKKGKHRWSLESRALTHGPVFVYLNDGLTDDDIVLIGTRIINDSRCTALMTEGVEEGKYTKNNS